MTTSVMSASDVPSAATQRAITNPSEMSTVTVIRAFTPKASKASSPQDLGLGDQDSMPILNEPPLAVNGVHAFCPTFRLLSVVRRRRTVRGAALSVSGAAREFVAHVLHDG